MSDSEEAKTFDKTEVTAKDRGTAKGIVTKAAKALRRHVSERNVDAIRLQLDKIKNAFINFENKHDIYHATLASPKDIEESDSYFDTIDEEYIEVVDHANNFLEKVVT